MAKITGTPGRHRVPITQEDLEEGRLKKTSYVDCSTIFTVEKRLDNQKDRQAREEAPAKVKEELRRVLGL